MQPRRGAKLFWRNSCEGPPKSYFELLEIRGREPEVILAPPGIGIPSDAFDPLPIGIEGVQQGRLVRLHRGADLLQGPLLHMEGDLERGIVAPEADAASRLIEATARIGKMKAHLHSFPMARARGRKRSPRTSRLPGPLWPPALAPCPASDLH